VRKLLDGIGDHAGFLELELAFRAGTNVRLERRDAEALLIIDEEVDLGGEEVTMIHVWVYAVGR
jgi:hypothetical protein